MLVTLGSDLAAVRQAAAECGLEVAEGPAEVFRLPEFDIDVVLVFRLSPAAAEQCSRRPHGVGVYFTRGAYHAAWDGRNDGYGLTAYIGETGQRLRTAYVLVAAPRAAGSLGLAHASPGQVRADESTHLEFTDAMAQKKIIVRVGPTGDTTIQTEGFQGKACQDATKQLEQALGTVQSEKPTQEMYAPPEQTVQA